MDRTGRLLITLYISVSLYLLLSFVYGPAGIKATDNLMLYRNVLVSNISELEGINKDLIKKCRPYNEMNTIKLKAYEMGYIGEEQKKIYIRGVVKPDVYHALGKIIYKDRNGENRGPFIRSVSLICALFFYVFSSILISGKNGIKKIRK